MNLPPRNTSAVGNPNAGVLNTPPNSPSFHQVTTAAGQQEANDNSNLATQASQAGVEAMREIDTAVTAGNTAKHADNIAFAYKAQILANAGLTQGAQTMANLAQRYAPQGGNIEDISQAIRQGIGV